MNLRNTLFICIAAMISSCGGNDGSDIATYNAFGAPEQVSIVGYSGNIMEPFLSRDGQHLFFNDNVILPGTPPVNTKNLHYAHYNVLSDTFTYAGEIGPGVNDSSTVQGVPTMDANDNFFFVDTKYYDPLGSPPVYVTLFTGAWDGTIVSGISPIAGLEVPAPGFLNFDLDVSPDGQTIWFNDGFFSGGTVPDAADIKIATMIAPGQFARAPDSDTILANVNTSTDLEYAPAISADGLELFFTRLDPTTLNARIFRTTRSGTGSAFMPPQLVSAIPGFAEGATFSPDEKTIYYHWHNTSVTPARFELYRVTRP